MSVVRVEIILFHHPHRVTSPVNLRHRVRLHQWSYSIEKGIRSDVETVWKCKFLLWEFVTMETCTFMYVIFYQMSLFNFPLTYAGDSSLLTTNGIAQYNVFN